MAVAFLNCLMMRPFLRFNLWWSQILFETTFKKPVKQGVIIGKGRFEISEGRDFFGVSEVRNSEGELIALGRGSFRVSNWALSSVAGYQS
jgi:acyl-coenzyme A thioesterase PaaI-like protein